jgi:EpsI family protein
LISKGDQHALVVYWYQSRDRAVASEYEARFYLIADSIRFNRSDGSLIRVSTLMLPDESTETAEKRLISLLKDVVPMLDRYVPL